MTVPSSTLILPDLHQRLDWITRVWEHEMHGANTSPRRVVFLGDYWDVPEYESGACPVETLRRLVALKAELGDRLTLLIGNHDAAYLEPWFSHGSLAKGRAPSTPFVCSGGSTDTAKALHAELVASPDARALVEGMRFYAEIGGALLTHAGLDFPLFGKTAPEARNTLRRLDDLRAVFRNAPKPVTARCPLSGGTDERSGLLWNRAVKSLDRSYPALPQIFGHTAFPRTVRTAGSHLCLDGRQTVYGILDTNDSGHPVLTIRNHPPDGRDVALATPSTGFGNAVMAREIRLSPDTAGRWCAIEQSPHPIG